MPATDDQLQALDDLLEGAVWLGAELDTTYRVLALTVEPVEHPQGEVDDARLQVLLHPASVVVASLRVIADPPRVEAFAVEQLPDVVHALDSPTLTGPFVGQQQPGPEQWGPRPSLEGRSNAPDGHQHRILLEVVSEDRRFGLHAAFDEVELRLPDGQDVPIA